MTRVLLLALVAAVAGLLLVDHRRAEAAETRLAAVASELAGRPVRVHCQGSVGATLDVGSEAGSVAFDAERHAVRRRPTSSAASARRCSTSGTRSARRELACVLRGEACPRDVLRSVWAVHTLAHEAWHLAGVRDEGVTECRALQTTAWTAVRLGATPAEARALAVYVLAHMVGSMPAEYRSPLCVDGGPLDLRPETPVWP